MGLKQKVTGTVSNVKTYWRRPPEGRYMTFKEIGSYAFGGIGAYFIIQLGSTLIVSTTNLIVSNAIGVGPMDSYIIYLLATILNIPMTGIRANMIDNTRGKGGKYRPYLLSMGIPTALIALVYVWFPYAKMYSIFPGKITFLQLSDGYLIDMEKGYIIKLVVVFICNLALHFFFNFFRDAYENLIHVISPNTQERTDVLAVKAVVYSLAPSIMNIVNPIIAQVFANDNQTNLIVYRITYPIYAIIGIGLTIVVWANTKEKIVQAKTHTVQVRFMDALREVAKNKYFWIIALAGWLGFLEMSYQNILVFSQSYGKTASGSMFAIASTIIGNASLWGMLFAPFFIKRFGKKKVLITVNLMNVVCILLMLVNFRSFWWLVFCVWANYLFGSVEQITTPAIQADIRDYQQYKSGERIDGMFAAVATIGNTVTLITSAVLPAVQKKFGIYEGNSYAGKVFEKPFDILDIKDGDPTLLYRFLPVLIVMAAAGAFLNVVPYFFYDFNEKKQKSVIRVLKVRALFEDYSNGALSDENLVEAIDLVNNAKTTSGKQIKEKRKLTRTFLKISGNVIIALICVDILGLLLNTVAVVLNKLAVSGTIDLTSAVVTVEAVDMIVIALALFAILTIKWDVIYSAKKSIDTNKKIRKDNREINEYNEEIDISCFVCDELDKFSDGSRTGELAEYSRIYNAGLEGIKNLNPVEIAAFKKQAKAMPKSTKAEKEQRKAMLEIAKGEKIALKAYNKYYKDKQEFVEPDIAVLEECFEKEDKITEKIRDLYAERKRLKKEGEGATAAKIKKEIKVQQAALKKATKESKEQMDRQAYFNRAAKIYCTARRVLAQEENYKHYDEIAAMYDEATERVAEAKAQREAEVARLEEADRLLKEQLKAEKEAKNKGKKNK